jgi:hypothetical protein
MTGGHRAGCAIDLKDMLAALSFGAGPSPGDPPEP